MQARGGEQFKPPLRLECDSVHEAGGFRTCCTRGRRADHCKATAGYSPCSGRARNTDAIIFVVQKQHKTYDESHNSFGFLSRALLSLHKRYIRYNESDLLLWHEGDFQLTDLTRLPIPEGVNARLCLLNCCSGWGAPPEINTMPYFLPTVRPKEHWAPGYFFMIRFYAITMWTAMRALGYNWVMRMDDDSTLCSTIRYNIFESMRSRKQVYGYRNLAPYTTRVCKELDMLATATPELMSRTLTLDGVNNSIRLAGRTHGDNMSVGHRVNAWTNFCERHAELGFYNNWFVTSVDWWVGGHVRLLQRRFEESELIFTRRLNDLVFQTIVVQTLLPTRRRRHFLDFSYEHVTVRNGSAVVGGFESGYDDPDGFQQAQLFRRRWGKGLLKRCNATETAEPHARWHTTHYVSIRSCPQCEDYGGKLPRMITVKLPVHVIV